MDKYTQREVSRISTFIMLVARMSYRQKNSFFSVQKEYGRVRAVCKCKYEWAQ